MTNRIPPSLAWLIDKRARIAGEIEKTRKSLIKAQKLIDELKELEKLLTAIDTTLELHDIKIDISLIEPIQSQSVRVKIPHGQLTRSILTCIKLYGDEVAVSKSTILDFVIARHYELGADEVSKSKIADSIHNRLKNLCNSGVITRCHSKDSNQEGLWKLSNDFKL